MQSANVKLRLYPDSALREVGTEVTVFDERLHSILDQMKSIMYEHQGIGLAANQVGVTQRFFIADVAPMFDEEYVQEFGPPTANDQKLIEFINPVIEKRKGKIRWNEGCLSLPSVFLEIDRADEILIRAQDRFGKKFEVEARHVLSVCCQHEYDHLDGKIFLDYVGLAKRESALKKLKKLKRDSERS